MKTCNGIPVTRINKCSNTLNINKIIAVKSGWNYSKKFAKALEENNTKYINTLLKKGIAIIIQ